jgi:predicted RecA/RadA family phage recombinase
MAQTLEAIMWKGPQEMVDHTPEAAIAAGKIVPLPLLQTTGTPLIGIALTALEAARIGALCIAGQFKIKKKAGAVFLQGQTVGFDVGVAREAVEVGDAGLDIRIGVCVLDAEGTDDFVCTKINAAMGAESSN